MSRSDPLENIPGEFMDANPIMSEYDAKLRYYNVRLKFTSTCTFTCCIYVVVLFCFLGRRWKRRSS